PRSERPSRNGRPKARAPAPELFSGAKSVPAPALGLPGPRVDSAVMEVLRITPRGYCHGVVDAFRIAKRVRESTDGPVHMLGQLVHNTHATDGLQEQGIRLVDPPNRLAGLEQIAEGTVIFTAHGVSPQVKERAVEMGLKAVDATCSDVVRTHELVEQLARRGYDVVYIGRNGHPEPEGVIGEAPGRVHLVQDAADIEALGIWNERVAV